MLNRAWQSIKELFSLLLPKGLPEYAVFLVAFCYFLGCSVYLNNLIPRNQQLEILGFDYSTYLRQFSELDSIFCFPFRHPFFGFILAPFIVVGHLLNTLSSEAYLYYLCVAFSACVSLSVLVCYKIQQQILQVRVTEAIIGCFLFSSFAYMPILAAVPESFSISMLILIVTIYMGGRQLVLGKNDSVVQWLTLFILAGGITITNAIKVGFAFLMSNRLNNKEIRMVALGCMALMLLGFSGFYLRMARYNASHPEDPKTMMRSLRQTCSWIRTDLSFTDKIDISAARFFSEPIVFHGKILRYHEIPLRYESAFPYFLLGTLYALVLISIALNLKSKVTWLILSLFSVDVLIHLFVFWSTVEGQLFCGHWFFILPIFLAQSFTKIKNEKLRSAYCIALVLLASGILISNLRLLLQAAY